MTQEIRIYVADLAAYNNGKLHGVWIDAMQEIEEIQKQIHKMLAQSPEGFAEEYAIHDYEGFGNYRLGEYAGIQTAHDIACFIAEHSEIGSEILNHFDGDLEEATAAMEDQYRGQFASLADFAQELTEETTEIPKHLEYYIDYERMARDMEMNGDIYIIQTAFDEVHVFWSH